MHIMTATGWIKTAVLGLCLGLLFFFFLHNQHLYSFGSADWSHAYFIPAISFYLLWQNRKELAVVKVRPFWPGLLPVLVGVPAYVLFQVSALSNHMAQGWAAVLCLFGVVLLTCGPRVMKLAFLPIAFLVFGITISEKIMILVTFQLQLIASKGAWGLLNLVGISTEAFGNVLQVTDSAGVVHDLNVAEACSGMRMVIAFAALGVAVALSGVQLWWQRIALMVLALPVAILMNVLRVGVLGYATLFNANLAAGQAHMLIGTLLLVPAFALYMGIVWCFNRAVQIEQPALIGAAVKAKAAVGANAKGGQAAAVAAAARLAGVSWSAMRQPSFVSAVAVLLISAATLNAAVSAMGVHLRKQRIEPPENRRVSAIATETQSYQRVGQDQVMSQEIVEELGTTNYLQRTYQLKEGKQVKDGGKDGGKERANPRLDVHIAYYTGMIDTVPHVPERCMTGAGWQIVGFPKSVPLKLDDRNWRSDTEVPDKVKGMVFTARLEPDVSKDAKADRVRLPFNPDTIELRTSEFAGPGTQKLIVGYYFIANGGHTPSAEGVRSKAFNLTDDYAFYLKVQVGSRDVLSVEELGLHTGRLMSELLPEIMRCVPDWVEVQEGRYPADNPRRPKIENASGRPDSKDKPN